jgi:sialic acid synthase SpsE
MDRMAYPKVAFRDRVIGGGSPTYIIAEVGTNHGGSLDRAKELISLSARAGADAVKFQSWKADRIQNSKERTAEGKWVPSTVLPVLQRYEVPREWHGILAETCREEGVDFLSTPFDVETARLLRDTGVPAMKISSSDLVYDELLEEVSGYGLPVFLSVGMANLGEIERALTILDRGGMPEVVLLHCIAMYPPRFEETNLRVIRTLREAFGLPVGFSDHFPGHEIDVAAVALGACVIEKHVTLSREDGAPDSFYALEMDEFRRMVGAVRILEQAFGDGCKACMPCEAGGLVHGRRSIYAARNLKAGSVLTREDIAIVRPNLGELKPRDWKQVIGARLMQDVQTGCPLRWSDLEPRTS